MTNNIRNLYGDIAAWGVTQGIHSAFLSVFALRMGATPQQVGLIAALPALVYIFWFIPAGRLVESRRNIRSAGVLGLFLSRLQYLIIALLPFLPPGLRVPAMLATITLAAFPVCIANVAITSVIGDAVSPAQRPRVVSTRNILLSLFSSLASFLGGALLDLLPQPGNYQVIFLIAFAASLLSTLYVSRLDTPLRDETHSFSLHPRRFVRQIGDIVATASADRVFLRFTVAAVVLHAALVFGWPLFSLWWVNGMKASEGWIGIILTAHTVVAMLSNQFWARVAERRGNRFIFTVGFAGVTLIPLMAALAPSVEFLIVPEAVSGLIVPAMSLGLFNLLLELSPSAKRPAYVAFFSAAVNVPMFLAPIIATSIVAPIIGVQAALGGTTFLRLIALGVVILLVRER